MKPRTKWRLMGLVVVLVVLALLAGACSPSTPSGSRQSASTENLSAPAESDALNQAIEVHGDWTITIRERDGSLGHRHEFANALTCAVCLAHFLARRFEPGFWQVQVEGPTTLCGTQNFCRLDEDTRARGAHIFPLDARVPVVGPGAGRFRLTGNATASADSSITRVSTFVDRCRVGGDTRQNCRDGIPLTAMFTRSELPEPIPVERGQIIQTDVRISFASS